MRQFNILFTSAGRRVSLIYNFKKAMQELGLDGNIVTTDLKKNAPVAFIAEVHELVPHVKDLNYITVLKDICKKHAIDLVVPLIDSELDLLSLHKQDFAAIGVTLLVSSHETNQISFDKRNTYSFFKKVGVQTPKILNTPEILAAPQAQYPLLIKPATGSCSVGVTKIDNAKELAFFQNYVPNAIVQEFVSGEEYTLDILVDFQGCVRCVVPRLRIETRAGEISKGVTVKNPALIAAGKQVVEQLPGAIGCITVQCFLTPNNEIQFIEINPRFGGGFPLSFQAGANFPRWIIEMILGKEPHITLDGWQEGIVMLRYDDAIFVNQEAIVC
ncbi:transcriptional regulator [Chroococcidiopsis sp. CCALA 051]|nr:ATP-grasp domain-containing protein [Chroococcidiopsidales cyanobacterium LEGE 13417]PSM48512.1 transcriptional regulator [Chroococcidiopsis sp. CCALA 051]